MRNTIDGKRGWDSQGRMFVAAAREETAPGIFETVLGLGWYPGMPRGQEIIKIEWVNGRPRYTVRDPDGKVVVRCLRRRFTDRPRDSLGFCQQWEKADKSGACDQHQGGEQVVKKGRLSVALSPGEPKLPKGRELVGFIPATPGGDTYIVKMPDGRLLRKCLRTRHYITGGDYCLASAGYRLGRKTGCCKHHGGSGNGPWRVLNLMDPQYLSLIGRAAKTNVAMEQIRDRIDLVRYAWYSFLDGVTKREKLLDSADDDNPVERDIGLNEILAAARNIMVVTLVQNEAQKEVFKATAKVWAQQAYALKMAKLLAEIAEEEREGSGKEVGRKSLEVMTRRKLITDDTSILHDPQSTELATVANKGTHAQELAMLKAMGSKKFDYNYMVEALGPKILSLYPLITVLNDMLVAEQAHNAPLSVKNRIMATIVQATKQQSSLEKAMKVDVRSKDARVVGDEVIRALMEAMADEDELFQLEVLQRFQERQGEIKMDSTGVDKGVGKAIIAMKANKKKSTTTN